jgi:hypothetical protein
MSYLIRPSYPLPREAAEALSTAFLPLGRKDGFHPLSLASFAAASFSRASGLNLDAYFPSLGA